MTKKRRRRAACTQPGHPRYDWWRAMTAAHNRIRNVFRMEAGKQSLGQWDSSSRWLEEHLGYSSDELVADIRGKFERWMSFDNHGRWHLDHIRPKRKFKRGPVDEDVRRAFSLDNLRPLEAGRNMRRSKWT